MKPEDIESKPAAGENTRGAAETPAGVADQAAATNSDSRLIDDLRKIAAQGSDTVDALQSALDAARELLSAEAALARAASLRIVVLTVLACVLLLSGWLCLVAALVAVLHAYGLAWQWAASAAAGASLLLGGLALWRVSELAPLLRFARSRRHLAGDGLKQ